MKMKLECAPNFRDLGGIVLADGRPIRPGLIYRSEAITTPSDADRDVLAGVTIGSVLDLRRLHERQTFQSYWYEDARTITLPEPARGGSSNRHQLLADDPSYAGGVCFMNEAYRELPATSAKALRLLLDAINDDRLPTIIHCTAGKDRTGFVVAALLLALGATHEAVYSDYLESDGQISDSNREASRTAVAGLLMKALPDMAMVPLLEATRTYLDIALGVVESRYGSISAYFDTIGIDARARAAALERLAAK